MKILLVSSYLPYPLYSGGHVRLFNIIRELSKTHEITLVCEKRDYQTEEDIQEVKKYCKEVVTIPRKKQWSLQNILKSGYSALPFLMIGHTSGEMKKKIQHILSAEKFDLIHVETFYVYQNIPDTELPIVLVEHNVEYLVYKRYVQNAPFFLRPFLLVDVIKLKTWEEKYWKEAAKLIAVSKEEKEVMKSDAVVVPNGVNVDEFTVTPSKFETNEKRVLFIGDFRWIQNKDAVNFLLKSVWPRIEEKNNTLKLWIVGRHIPSEIRNSTNSKNVLFDENAPKKTSEIYAQSFILLAPIRVGGGTSFKILEAMASGVPVVTTRLGIEGIKAKTGEEVLIGETAEELVKNTLLLCKDEKIYEGIRKNARKLIEHTYNWEKIVGELEKTYMSVIKKP